MNTIKIVLIFSLSFLIQQFAIAQEKQNIQFLQNVGTPDSLYSNILKEQRKIYIQIPESYEPSQNQKYPVIYILDGDVFLPTVTNVHNFYSGGFMPEMLIVGISNANNRMRDLTTSKVTEMWGMPLERESGEAANFIKFIESELIPFVENKYPASNYRTLIGHSYGGLFTTYALINHPEIFANYIAIDPSLNWDGQKLLKEAQRKLANNTYEGKSLFMSLGGQLHMQNAQVTIDNVMKDTSDFTLFARSNIAFADLARNNKGLAFNWKFYPNDLHGTIPFPSIMDGLVSLFEWYQMENTDKINSYDTTKESLRQIIKYREQKLKDRFGYLEPPYPEEILNMLGYMNMDMDKLDKSKMYFEFAIEYYPQSANAYDSMADYYEKNEDYKNALIHLKKAFEISGDDSYRDRIVELEKKK